VTPIRIYLAILRINNEWDYLVYRDIESIRDAWTKNLILEKWQLAVVHVGYDRPDYDSETLLEIISDIEKPVFLTEAARWSLPVRYAVCSNSPVACCTFLNRIVKCPIYLTLNEWGYAIDEADLNIDSVSSNIKDEYAENLAEGWLKILLEDNSELANKLFQKKIFSEEEYIKRRMYLDPDVLEKADNYRFNYFYKHMSSEDTSNPFAILEIAPTWLLDCHTSRVNPTVRLLNVLKSENIIYIRDLLNYSSASLLRLPNFGKKTLVDLAKSLTSTYQEFNQSTSLLTDGVADITLFDHLTKTLSSLPETPKKIIIARLGADGNNPLTLQQLGDVYGITRERIRQIEKKYLLKIIERESWDNVLIDKIEALLRKRTTPLYLDMLCIEDEWFAGFSQKLNYLEEIILRFSEQKMSIITFNNRKIISKINQDNFDNALQNIRHLLEENIQSGWSKSHIINLVETKTLGYGAPELSQIIFDSFIDNLHFIKTLDDEILIGVGRSTESMIMAVLENMNTPAHYSEIHHRLLETTDKTIDVRRVHAILTANPLAKLYDRGTYGLKKHLMIAPEDASKILSLTEELINNGPPQKQWHLDAVLQSLLENNYDMPDELNTYNLGVILEESNLLTSLGKQVWVSKYQEGLSANDRIQTIDIFITILEQEGKPLTVQELIDKASTYRGIKPSMQIHPNEILIKISANMWGLSYRDLPLPKEKIAEYQDILYSHLTDVDKGIHISELSVLFINNNIPLPSYVDPYIFLTFSSLDARFKVWHGQLIGLSSWTSPRRETVASAFRKVFENLDKPTSLDIIYHKVENILGRSLDKMTISAALCSNGGMYDKENELWLNPNLVLQSDFLD